MSNNNISAQTKNDSKGYVTELNDSELNEIQGGNSSNQTNQSSAANQAYRMNQTMQIMQILSSLGKTRGR